MEQNQTQEFKGIKIERPRRNDLIYAIIIVLMLVLGFIGGAVMQLNDSAKTCNTYFNTWINENCVCNDYTKNMGIVKNIPTYNATLGVKNGE